VDIQGCGEIRPDIAAACATRQPIAREQDRSFSHLRAERMNSPPARAQKQIIPPCGDEPRRARRALPPDRPIDIRAATPQSQKAGLG